MRQFIHGGKVFFSDLERRARGACVVFHNEEMPPGSVPPHARVGFEANPVTGVALLLVDQGIEYRGSNAAVREWLETGEKRFPSFDHLRRWIREDLGSCYSSSTAQESTTSASHIPPRPEDLTDLAAVQAGLKDVRAPLYLDEEALFRELSGYVRGQDDALRMLARRVRRHAARRSPRRPPTVFAVGPTGVGKTRTAESLPLALRSLDPSGAGYSYLRLDMSEYQEPHRISQLLGAPQGYVGYGDGAQLVDALIANQKTVVLFDEIEKAHRDILQALMNAMDAGRLSTPSARANGREVDCRYAIFFFTSNLDATGILRDLEDRDAFGNTAVIDEVCRSRLHAAGIAPELVGRISCFLVFRPLTPTVRAEIVALAITRVAAEYGLRVSHIEPSVIVNVLNHARSVGFGARPDEYLVDEILGAAFAEAAAIHTTLPIEVRGGPPLTCVPIVAGQSSNGGG